MLDEDGIPYNLLENRGIYQILIGMTECGAYMFKDDHKMTRITMPRMYAADISEMAKDFNVSMKLTNEAIFDNTGYVAANYMGALLEHCVKTKRCSDLLSKLFDAHRFYVLGGHNRDAVNDAYKTYMRKILDIINGYLCLDGAEMVYVGGRYIVKKIGDRVEPLENALKIVDAENIKEVKRDAMKDIKQRNFSEAIVKSSSLVENVFGYILSKNNIKPAKSFSQKYNQILNLFQYHADADVGNDIKDFMSGLNKIVTSLFEIRSNHCKIHYEGGDRLVEFEEHHAVLCLNSAIAVSEFFLALDLKQNRKVFEVK